MFVFTNHRQCVFYWRPKPENNTRCLDIVAGVWSGWEPRPADRLVGLKLESTRVPNKMFGQEHIQNVTDVQRRKGGLPWYGKKHHKSSPNYEEHTYIYIYIYIARANSVSSPWNIRSPKFDWSLRSSSVSFLQQDFSLNARYNFLKTY